MNRFYALGFLLMALNGILFWSVVIFSLIHFPTYYFPATGEMDFYVDFSKFTVWSLFMVAYAMLNLYCASKANEKLKEVN